MNEMIEEIRHLFSQLLQKNPRLNVRDMPGCAASDIASPIDESSAQAVKGQNLPHSSESTHNRILQKQSRICNLQSGIACCNLESAICNLELHAAFCNFQSGNACCNL
ncbi:hypothetical protein H5410_056777 [Solanum commersonii]|uniref:Uncharacterized protein n=1 Tax=Solanum commersonii TaxID=4109 RepID=A0A9J5WL67_SOLCO|nr:hypothetical protein H5410_056777 [Solanum commersonii]